MHDNQATPENPAVPADAPRRDVSRQAEEVLQYHRLSSLDPTQRAAMPEQLEWRHQPVPFRRYEGAPRVLLPLAGEVAAVDEPVGESPPGETPEGAALSRQFIGRLLEHSLALAGWKRSGTAAFGLRVTPSAGNLHPLESYVLAPALESRDQREGRDQEAALYHYSPFDHALERRRWLSESVWSSLREACPRAHVFIGLSAIYWRCAWKYGERAFRLSHLDAGHAMAALDAAASLEGCRLRYVETTGADLRCLLGLVEPVRQESEDAICLMAVEPTRRPMFWGRWAPPVKVRKALVEVNPCGVPTDLGRPHRSWPGIPAVAGASHRRRDAPLTCATETRTVETPRWNAAVLKRRRSRSKFADRPLTGQDLGRLLDGLVGPTASSVFPWHRDLAVLLFVHRVDGLEPGLLAALPSVGSETGLKSALRQDFTWRRETVETWKHPLWRLASEDTRRAATHLAGGQGAAGDSAFTALFLARFRPLLEEHGGFAYRRVHWQAGELGHRLYLAAEREGLGATGLAGFFDGQLSAVLGLQDDSWRPLYLCAVGHRGGADPSLESPYAHRGRGAIPLPASAGGMKLKNGP